MARPSDTCRSDSTSSPRKHAGSRPRELMNHLYHSGSRCRCSNFVEGRRRTMTVASRRVGGLLLALVAGGCDSAVKVVSHDDLSMSSDDGGLEDLASAGPMDAPPPPPPIEPDAFIALPPFIVGTSPLNTGAGVSTSPLIQ